MATWLLSSSALGWVRWLVSVRVRAHARVCVRVHVCVLVFAPPDII